MSVRNTTGEILYVNADWSKIVPESSPDAAFVLVGVGGRVPQDHAGLYLSLFGDDAEQVDDEPTAKVIRFGGDEPPTPEKGEPTPDPDPEPEQAETPKPRKKRAAKKAAAKSD